MWETKHKIKTESSPGPFDPLKFAFCHWDHSLCLNAKRSKEKIIDLRKRGDQSTPSYIKSIQVESMETFNLT